MNYTHIIFTFNICQAVTAFFMAIDDWSTVETEEVPWAQRGAEIKMIDCAYDINSFS